MFSDRLTCCVPGCAHSASRVTLPECIEVMCEEHYALASPAALARRARSEERLRSLQQRWDDEAYFDRLVASGKYLKMCGMLSLASEKAERAWSDVKAEVIAAARAPGVAAKVGAEALA
jgi:hypothetical protein